MSSNPLAFPTIALLSSILVLVPLPWQLEAWNIGTCLYMIWTSLACLNFGINSIIWRADAINRAPIWCDISSRIIVATSVALPASSLCILRRLHKIITAPTLMTSTTRRKDAIIDLSIGVGIPLIQLVMQYVVSGHRFDIFEGAGCYPFTYNTPVAYPLSITWPIVIGMVSAIYCVLTLRALMRRRAQLAEFFSSNSSLTAQRYIRLMAMAIMEMLCTVPISSYGMYLNLTRYEVLPWISWADTHFHYSKVGLYPSILWHENHVTALAIEISRWLPVGCALVFFIFFGIAEDARRHYWQGLVRVASFLHLRRTSTRSVLPLADKLPAGNAYLSRPTPARKSSLSFSMTDIGESHTKSDSFDLPLYTLDCASQTMTDIPSPSTASTLLNFPEKAHV